MAIRPRAEHSAEGKQILGSARVSRQSSGIPRPLSTATHASQAHVRRLVYSLLLHSHHGDEVWKRHRMFLVVQMFSMNSPFRTESEGGLEGEECL